MAGVGSMAVGAIDSAHHSGACLCVDALPISNLSLSMRWPTASASAAAAASRRSPVGLSSSFLDARRGRRRLSLAAISGRQQRSKRRGRGGLVVLNELGGQYEEGFDDVHKAIINYFTYKATRTVLHQLYEMNPPKYTWFYNYIATNPESDGKLFLRGLGKERQDLAERVMITRLHLYAKWIKKLDHAKMYQRISDENLALMRERLMETVIWPSDDTNTEKIG